MCVIHSNGLFTILTFCDRPQPHHEVLCTRRDNDICWTLVYAGGASTLRLLASVLGSSIDASHALNQSLVSQRILALLT